MRLACATAACHATIVRMLPVSKSTAIPAKDAVSADQPGNCEVTRHSFNPAKPSRTQSWLKSASRSVRAPEQTLLPLRGRCPDFAETSASEESVQA